MSTTRKRLMQTGGAFMGTALLVALLCIAGRPLPMESPGVGASLEITEPKTVPAEFSTADVNVSVGQRPQSQVERTEQRPDRELAILRERFRNGSLRGTAPDGAVALDADGQLSLDPSLLQRFDYYLSMTGELEPDAIRRLLQADLRDQLGDAIADAAMAQFDRYVGLRNAIANAALSSDPATRLAQLQQLRNNWFGASTTQLFGAEDAELAATLAGRSIEQDPELDAAQRAALLDELDAMRSASERESQRQASAALMADQQTRQFDHLDIDEASRHEERAALWGEEAADRLAALDQQRAEWDRRLAEYAAARQQLTSNGQLDAAEREQALIQLREARFDANERARIEALEAVGALAGG